MNEKQLESELQAKGLNAPRVTPDHIDSVIVGEYFFTAADGVVGSNHAVTICEDLCEDSGVRERQGLVNRLNLLTFCVLVLRNGFTVTGESACASPENFDAQVGRDIARTNAREKIWALEGYLLKEKLSAV